MKKLFTYLLISSMVVLSSCTNYDDQFDDLNAQINTLKSQIEGFSSLSTGLTALQGTVASLQTAIQNIPVTPATDVSGLATAANLAALDTALTALAAEVDALTTALANAATAAEVAALQTALTQQQANLNELLAANNVYSASVVVASQADLDFATALGNKVTIINGGLDITQTTTMDATQLATLMGKVMSVTGNVTYTATVSSTTPGEFTKLNGAANVTLTVAAAKAITLPALKETGNLSITATETTAVSLPVLVKAASFGTLNFPDATSFSMPVMVDHHANLSITVDNAGTVDLSAFTNATTSLGAVEKNNNAHTLTVNAATLTAPVYAMGEIDADRLTEVDLPKWQFAAGSSFQRAKKVVLPSVTPAYASTGSVGYGIQIDTVFDDATYVHLIAAASTKATTPVHMSANSVSTRLETLILGGTYATVDITGTDLINMTFDGTAKDVTIDSTDIETLNLPYTSAASGKLVVTDNSKLTSLTADKVNGLATFTLTGNADLTTISFAALKTTATTGADVDVRGNDLMIDSLTDASTTPKVDKKIVSVDFTVLKPFLTDAISKVSATSPAANTVSVSVDLADVTRAYTSAGVERDAVAGDEIIAAYSYLKPTDNGTTGVQKQEEMYITSLPTGVTNIFQVENSQGVMESVSIVTGTGLEDFYDVKAWAESATTKSALAANGLEILGATLAGERTATFNFADATLTNVSAVVNFKAGVDNISVTTGSASSTTEIAEAIKEKLNLGFGTVSQYYDVQRVDKGLLLTSLAKGSHRQPFAFTWTAHTVSSNGTALTKISFAAASTVKFESIENLGGAVVKFRSTGTAANSAKKITLVGAGVNATLLTASGISTAHAGDDEFYVAPVVTVTATSDNSAAVTAAKLDNVQYITGS